MSTSTLKQEPPERKKVKKKMSKAQMQLAIIKKKQCDAKALTIVEQLLEPNIDSQWLLYNLRYINKNHMEDVIEERSIIKLCGYVLCSNALTTVIDQKYHISTRKNKVYDITRRKNFCTSRCYGACNYLLEQMLTSPLWLRDKEEIPEFKLLPEKDLLERSTPGEEIPLWNTNITVHSDNKDKLVEHNEICEDVKDKPLNKDVIFDNECSILESSQTIIKATEISDSIQESEEMKEKFLKISDKDPEYVRNESIHLEDTTNNPKQCTNDTTIKDLNNDVTCLNEARDCNKINNEEQTRLSEVLETECNITAIKQDSNHLEQKIENKKNKKHKQKHHVKEKQSSEFYNLTMHIECSVKEWITEDTLCLLSGEEDIKQQLLDNIRQHNKYLHLCKKLNKLQLEDEKDDRIDITKSTLKPLPHLSVLQEEGKKIELKVRAFYKGDLVTETSSKITDDTEKDEPIPLLPLIDVHTPKALRRRIFLDKLDRILPDLIQALAGNGLPHYTYTSEKSALIKALVNTFSLSATNITFKTAEWTLVGLIIIKMLGMIDPQLKVLLSKKQASMYISMILMSYKLDSNYLDRTVAELTNNTKIVNIDDTISF
ncbi:putative RNA polymerase II subunit B1 CTD phosphatase RPAP2 [Colletes gigas]|uniref:putative RNA polymerase II subunit B1 CTD phosphatase RPAP2 n=1 Tax=Colletes gigas TaxID=935657 RepID=UPI001C9BA4A1|nr:putative RNA polymerase II subunit B1 CTD phosphatase RPAP2 [Colletes gigas]